MNNTNAGALRAMLQTRIGWHGIAKREGIEVQYQPQPSVPRVPASAAEALYPHLANHRKD